MRVENANHIWCGYENSLDLSDTWILPAYPVRISELQKWQNVTPDGNPAVSLQDLRQGGDLM